ncbi:hypothetical protein N7513_005866 [Penicillium frequentans]|nr:hypothetical protein N7513_005866 [Penicillium glabrum]
MARHSKSKARMKRAPATAKPSPHRFTMQQEARNTETHTRSWSHSNLRNKAVQFVSAGQLQRTEQDVEEEGGGQTETQLEVTELEIQGTPEAKEDAGDNLFFLDTIGEEVVHTGLPDPTLHSDFSDTEGSEDEVVFTGRRKPIAIETDEAELQEYLQRTQNMLLQAAASSEDVQPNHQVNVAETPPAPRTQQEHHPLSDGEANKPADSMANKDHGYDQEHAQISTEAEGGIGLGRSGSELDTEGSQSVQTEFSHIQLEQYTSKGRPVEDAEDAEVIGSIDELSKMYLDTEPDSSSTSKDDDADLDSPDESDEDSDDMDDEGLLEELAASFSAEKKGSRGKHTFLSATAFADALDADPYYGLDIMDFDRPSLQKRPKGKKPHPLEGIILSDSDLDNSDLEILQDVWETDRKKKKAKKQEREELRSQGLLGRKSGDPDLKVKYAKGMNLDDLISEIRTFLLSPKSSLALPPMTKHRRKTIHELANKVTLKSQSRGNGLTRFPILLKTSHTPKYTRKTIPQFDNLLSGRKLNRRLYQSWGPDASRPSKAKRSGGSGAVSYMDGDVVGASAPEIGAGNRGRAMLEKMGWSSGTALGASNNKGILQPVTQVVKNSRAGLG